MLAYLDRDPESTLEWVRRLAPVRPVIIVSRDRDPDFVVRALRAGARDFVYLEQRDELRHAVQALHAHCDEVRLLGTYPAA